MFFLYSNPRTLRLANAVLLSLSTGPQYSVNVAESIKLTSGVGPAWTRPNLDNPALIHRSGVLNPLVKVPRVRGSTRESQEYFGTDGRGIILRNDQFAKTCQNHDDESLSEKLLKKLNKKCNRRRNKKEITSTDSAPHSSKKNFGVGSYGKTAAAGLGLTTAMMYGSDMVAPNSEASSLTSSSNSDQANVFKLRATRPIGPNIVRRSTAYEDYLREHANQNHDDESLSKKLLKKITQTQSHVPKCNRRNTTRRNKKNITSAEAPQSSKKNFGIGRYGKAAAAGLCLTAATMCGSDNNMLAPMANSGALKMDNMTSSNVITDVPDYSNISRFGNSSLTSLSNSSFSPTKTPESAELESSNYDSRFWYQYTNKPLFDSYDAKGKVCNRTVAQQFDHDQHCQYDKILDTVTKSTTNGTKAFNLSQTNVTTGPSESDTKFQFKATEFVKNIPKSIYNNFSLLNLSKSDCPKSKTTDSLDFHLLPDSAHNITDQHKESLRSENRTTNETQIENVTSGLDKSVSFEFPKFDNATRAELAKVKVFNLDAPKATDHINTVTESENSTASAAESDNDSIASFATAESEPELSISSKESDISNIDSETEISQVQNLPAPITSTTTTTTSTNYPIEPVNPIVEWVKPRGQQASSDNDSLWTRVKSGLSSALTWGGQNKADEKVYYKLSEIPKCVRSSENYRVGGRILLSEIPECR